MPMLARKYLTVQLCLLLSGWALGLSFLRTVNLSLSHSRSSVLTSLDSVSKKREVFIDGAEWASVRNCLSNVKNHFTVPNLRSTIGRMSVVVGTTLDSYARVVGIEAPRLIEGVSVALAPDCFIYSESMARVPSRIKDDEAIMTLTSSLASVHCALPKANQIGGSMSDFISGKVVVIGGSDFACFAARGLAAMGSMVALVTTGNPTIDDYRVEIYDPAVGELQIGFASHIGEFDSLVDTLSDEGNLCETKILGNDENLVGRSYSGLLALLKSRHKCSKYVSTMTVSQKIVRDVGVIFGPGKAKEHVKKYYSDQLQAAEIYPPHGFGSTVQTLLEQGITHSWRLDGERVVRTWSLPPFWELTSWPRDSSGSNIRFGFPSIDDIDVVSSELSEVSEEEKLADVDRLQANPFVVEIVGPSGLSQQVLEAQRSCLLFLTATYCRTCKSVLPGFTRFARLNQSANVVFAKADTTGNLGKELGKILNVNSVPTFLFFRDGKRFGPPLSITKLPSKKLDLAFHFLTSGMDWDSEALEQLDEKEGRTRP